MLRINCFFAELLNAELSSWTRWDDWADEFTAKKSADEEKRKKMLKNVPNGAINYLS